MLKVDESLDHLLSSEGLVSENSLSPVEEDLRVDDETTKQIENAFIPESPMREKTTKVSKKTGGQTQLFKMEAPNVTSTIAKNSYMTVNESHEKKINKATKSLPVVDNEN